ncbi:MAG: hypothetical protein U5K00_09070 [Melioribacteraceae bacterium]|nr:hypothetical protein [Melioribacteraceae bacterium]
MDNNEALYIGTSSTGFDIYNHNKIETYNNRNGLLHDNTWEILSTGNEIYFATDAGISILNKNTNSFVSITKRDGLISNSVRRFVRATDGTFYAGTWGGINVISNGRIKSYSEKDGLVHNHVMDLELDNNGNLHVATQGGLSIFDGNSFKNYTAENGLPENYLQSLLLASDSTMYIGTFGHGLLKMKDGRLDTLTIQKGLSGNNITCISEYDGKILIGTYESGLNILDDDSI